MDSSTIELDDARDLVVFTLRGPVIADDIIELGERHFLAHTTSNAIWDFTDADLSDIVVADMGLLSARTMAATTDRKSPRTAVIVNDEGKRALMRLYSAVAEADRSPIRYNIVSTKREALEWLGLTG